MGDNSSKSVSPVLLVDSTAECWGVVGQRKMFCAVTGKRNMSKVSPGLG